MLAEMLGDMLSEMLDRLTRALNIESSMVTINLTYNLTCPAEMNRFFSEIGRMVIISYKLKTSGKLNKPVRQLEGAFG